MPCVEATFDGIELTEALVARLENEIIAILRDTIADSFAVGLGYQPGTAEFEVAYQYVQEVMPGWTWLNFREGKWTVRGEHASEMGNIVCHLRILVLAEALNQFYRQKVAAEVFKVVRELLSENGKNVQLFVDIIEGEVDVTLPDDLFGALLKGDDHKLLKVNEIVEAMKSDINQRLTKQSKKI